VSYTKDRNMRKFFKGFTQIFRVMISDPEGVGIMASILAIILAFTWVMWVVITWWLR